MGSQRRVFLLLGAYLLQALPLDAVHLGRKAIRLVAGVLARVNGYVELGGLVWGQNMVCIILLVQSIA
jgi:hypothetical protein